MIIFYRRVMLPAILLWALMLFSPSYLEASFRDVTSDVGRAASSFTDEGLLDRFIFKYGRDLFRPDANVSRADLVLVLSEYNMITERLMEQNRRILSRINNMEQSSSAPDMDAIIREFQRVLDPMLQNSRTIRELQASSGGVAAIGDGASAVELSAMKGEVNQLRQDLDGQRRALEQIARSRPSGAAADTMNDAEELRREIASLRRDIERQQRTVARRDTGAQISTGEGGFPFWARVSLGLSSMSLFLMSR